MAYSRWTTSDELKNLLSPISYDSDIKKSGIPMMYDEKHLYIKDGVDNTLVIGSTGSGKSVTAVIPMCSFIATATKKRSVFITDPKGEIFNTTSKMFKDNSYNIITIDFRNPELSNKINLLEPIINEYEEYMKYDKLAINIESDINYLYSGIEMLKEDIELMKKYIK